MSQDTTQRYHDENASRMSHLESRVTGIESTLVSMVDTLKGLGNKLDARSQTPWPVIWSAAGVCTAIVIALGGLAYRPIEAAQARMDQDFRSAQAQIVSRVEHEGRWRQEDRDLGFLRDRIARMDARADKRLERLEERVFDKR